MRAIIRVVLENVTDEEAVAIKNKIKAIVKDRKYAEVSMDTIER